MTLMKQTAFIASIVIPAHNRAQGLDRAVLSVLSQNGAEQVEIIVIDDGSEPPMACVHLRPQDTVLRNPRNLGAPASRNRGIRCARGQLIYLLDSDDRFVQRDFIADARRCAYAPGLYYVDIRCAQVRHRYPSSMHRGQFVDFALGGRHPLIGQTSSLMFPATQPLYFDESLPRHQDWDLVLSYLSTGGLLHKIDGMIEYEAADKTSLSQVYAPERSLPWLAKLAREPALACTALELAYIKYLLIHYSARHYTWRNWFGQSWALLSERKISAYAAAKSLYLRLTKEGLGRALRFW